MDREDAGRYTHPLYSQGLCLMINCLSDKKKTKVLVVEKTHHFDQILVDIIKSHGFLSVDLCCDIETAIDFLKNNRPGWIITSMMMEQTKSLFNLLEVIRSHCDYYHTKISCLIDWEVDHLHLSKAFTGGLFSFHEKNFSQDDMDAEISDLFALLKMNNFNYTMTAADYCRLFMNRIPQPLSRLFLGTWKKINLPD